MGTYAKETTVPVAKSRAEIEQTLERYGADQFMSGWDEARAFLAFRIDGRHVRMVIPVPDPDTPEIKLKRHSSGHMVNRPPAEQKSIMDRKLRQRWRAVLLVIKAKLEAVESGISTVEEEFLAHIMLPDGNTFGRWAAPQIAEAYESGSMPPLLPAPKS